MGLEYEQGVHDGILAATRAAAKIARTEHERWDGGGIKKTVAEVGRHIAKRIEQQESGIAPETLRATAAYELGLANGRTEAFSVGSDQPQVCHNCRKVAGLDLFADGSACCMECGAVPEPKLVRAILLATLRDLEDAKGEVMCELSFTNEDLRQAGRDAFAEAVEMLMPKVDDWESTGHRQCAVCRFESRDGKHYPGCIVAQIEARAKGE
jgi:hypothetical protein